MLKIINDTLLTVLIFALLSAGPNFCLQYIKWPLGNLASWPCKPSDTQFLQSISGADLLHGALPTFSSPPLWLRLDMIAETYMNRELIKNYYYYYFVTFQSFVSVNLHSLKRRARDHSLALDSATQNSSVCTHKRTPGGSTRPAWSLARSPRPQGHVGWWEVLGSFFLSFFFLTFAYLFPPAAFFALLALPARLAMLLPLRLSSLQTNDRFQLVVSETERGREREKGRKKAKREHNSQWPCSLQVLQLKSLPSFTKK